ncbi:MAG TPA: sigma factor-like helix-turn-helix DNA-binding protein [Candidatus Angelobacter sp.]|jgi:RNA polymerase sigma factor (sigma-70 family)|nr:sigma factor-like helix-turn-helix DNA-binding protein [Candidatus Angelobacter sp.]
MNVHVSYKAGKTPDVEREFQHQLQKLERRLQVFKPELVHLHASVEQENTHSACASLNLRLPSGQMAAQRSGENALAAVKSAFADLLSQVTKHKDLLRGHWTRKAMRREGRERLTEMPVPAAPMKVKSKTSRLAKPHTKAHPASGAASHAADMHVSAAKTDSAVLADVEVWLSANLRKLEEFVDQELRFQVEADQMREDQISREEVIDEVIVSALSHEESRTQLLSLESWFHRLALQAIRRLTLSNADTANISLDAPAGTQNVTGSDENVLQYHQPDDSLPEESIIRDESVRTPEEIMAGDEMVAQLDVVLREVHAPDREAFVLYTLEGFTVDEISRLAGRPAEQVRQSIHDARAHIRQKLPTQNQLRKSLLHHSRVA